MPSDRIKRGPERAAHRSLLKAMGYSDREIAAPWVGVVNAWNELVPGHIHLDRIAAAARAGILAAGGTPMEFPSIGSAMAGRGPHGASCPAGADRRSIET
jgi:dihydroxy-acid dehydratase